MSKGFFKGKQAAAVLKHGLLGRYLPIFAAKTGSKAGEVVYLDGFAGPGLYDDGTPGSPALALLTAQKIAAMRGKATITGHLIESSASKVEQLNGLLGTHGVAWPVYQGRAQDIVPDVLSSLNERTPLFSFLDPFGLLIPFEQVIQTLRRSGSVKFGYRIDGAATEVLLNFSVPGINRVGGQLTATGTDPRWLKARDTMVSNMDAMLGGDWWRAIWTAGSSDRVEQICDGYVQALLDAAGPGWTAFTIPAADRWDGPPSYYLIFLTRHPDGVWLFHDSMSLAMEEYRVFCHQVEGRIELEPLAERETAWIAEIMSNVERLVARQGPFRPVDRIFEVYGRTAGDAREKHVRQALKNLYKTGTISTDCKGCEIPTFVVKR